MAILTPIKTAQTTGITLQDQLRKQGIGYTETPLDLRYVAAYGGAEKIVYRSPNSGNMIYALQVCEMYCADDFGTRVWSFDRDFSADEAQAFYSAERFGEGD